VVKRRHGLDRCRYKGYVGMNRWVGLGVIADNVVNIGRAMAKHGALLTASATIWLANSRAGPSRRDLRCTVPLITTPQRVNFAPGSS
jgi:hypothetical protein